MKTRVSAWTQTLIEVGWLMAVAAIPLFVNIYARSHFGPSKAALLRALMLVMAVAWLIAGIERHRARKTRELVLSLQSLKRPVLLAALVFTGITVLSTLLSVLPRISFWGSYERAQGLYTVLAYVLFFLLLYGHLRTSAQLERLIGALLLPSFPIALIAILQSAGYELIAGISSIQGRQAYMPSTLGNPIFMGAYLIMVIPLTAWCAVQAWAAPRARTWRDWGHLTAYVLLLLLQLVALGASQSRGPLLGLAAGVLFGVLLWATVRRSRRTAWLVVAAAAVLVVFLVVINVPGSPLAGWRDLPYVGRLATILSGSPRGIATGRVLIWRGTLDAITANPARTLIGYGPETLGFIFDRHYPSDLLASFAGAPERNARAHNVIMDVAATTGLVGLVAYLGLVIGAFYAGFRFLGLVRGWRGYVRLAAVSVATGVVLAVGAFVIAGTGDYAGLALSLGVVIGLGGYLLLKAIGRQSSAPETVDWSAGAGLTIALLTALAAHFTELSVGIPTVVTNVLFWVFVALLAVLARRGRDGDFWKVAPAAPKTPPSKRRGKPRGRQADPDARSGATPWIWGGLTGISLVTLTYGLFVPNAPAIVWVPILATWPFAAVLMDSERKITGPNALQDAGVFAGASLVPWLVFVLLQAQAVDAIRRGAFQLADLIWFYFLAIFILLGALAWILSSAEQTRRPRRSVGATIGYAIVEIVVLGLIVSTNVHPLRADAYFKLARVHAEEGGDRLDQAIQEYQRAISLQSNEPTYYWWYGRALIAAAERAGGPAAANPYLGPAQQALSQSYAMNPQDVEVALTLALLHWRWSEFATDQQTKVAHLTQVNEYFRQAAALRPNQASIHNEWAQARSQLEELTGGAGVQGAVSRPAGGSQEAGANAAPVGLVEERPGGNPPRMWIECLACAEAGEQVSLLDRPGGEPAAELPHGTWVYLLQQQQGPDGRTYYLVWGARRQGWIPYSRLSNIPP